MKSTRIVAAAVTLAALIGAGCSSSSDSPASSAPATAEVTPGSAAESTTSAASSASTTVASSEPAAGGSEFLFGDTTVELTGVSCTSTGDDTIGIVATGTGSGTTMTASVGSPVGDSNVVVTVFGSDNSYVRYFLSTTTNSGALEGENADGHVTLRGKGAAQGYDAAGASSGELQTDASSLDVTCGEIAPMAPAPTTTAAAEEAPETTG